MMFYAVGWLGAGRASPRTHRALTGTGTRRPPTPRQPRRFCLKLRSDAVRRPPPDTDQRLIRLTSTKTATAVQKKLMSDWGIGPTRGLSSEIEPLIERQRRSEVHAPRIAPVRTQPSFKSPRRPEVEQQCPRNQRRPRRVAEKSVPETSLIERTRTPPAGVGVPDPDLEPRDAG